jgi:arylformamidase
MEVLLPMGDQFFSIDLSQPLPIALPFSTDSDAASAWYCPPTDIQPVQLGDWVGSVAKGASVNFRNIRFNPHGNGTHTECVGHISEQVHSVVDALQSYNFLTYLVSIAPQILPNGDAVITAEQLQNVVEKVRQQSIFSHQKSPILALILRTLPNGEGKKKMQYTETNPPYLTDDAMRYLVEVLDIQHFLIDLPSVDREQDGGKLSAHHIFWQYPQATRQHCTITEFVFVPDPIADDIYFLQLQIAPFHNDATPSLPVLYRLKKYEKI